MDKVKKKDSFLTKLVIILGSICILFFAIFIVAGLYFSEILYKKALNPDRPPLNFDAKIISLRGDIIELERLIEFDNDYRSKGIFGISWDGGFGQVLEIINADKASSKRKFKLLSGEPPKPGMICNIDECIYPREPFPVPILPAIKVSYLSDLGNFDAYYQKNKKKNWVILVHGNGMSLADTRRFASSFNELNYPILVISYRNDKGQPRDPSGLMQYGITEWKEIEGAVKYALDNGSGPVILFGMSMGGGIVINFMHLSSYASKVMGLVLESPMFDLGRAVDINASKERIPGTGIPIPAALTNLAKFIAQLRFKINWNEMNYLKKVDNLNIPVLLFHSQADTTVPVSTSDEFYKKKRDIVFRYIRKEEAEHCQIWNLDPDEYKRNLSDFLDSL